MNTPVLTTPSPDRPRPVGPRVANLPRWEHLPAECQRDLVLTLTAMLLKRLPAPPPTPSEVRHE